MQNVSINYMQNWCQTLSDGLAEKLGSSLAMEILAPSYRIAGYLHGVPIFTFL